MLYVIARVKLEEGAMASFLEAAVPCVEATRLEPGNISYELALHGEEENVVLIIERWQNRAALDAHFIAPHFLTYRQATSGMVASRRIDVVTAEQVEVL